MTSQLAQDAIDLNCGGYRTHSTQSALDAIKPQIAALWVQITDPRDDAGVGRWYLPRAAVKAIPCPAPGVATDTLVDYVHQMQVGPDGRRTGWHVWCHQQHRYRFLCERE